MYIGNAGHFAVARCPAFLIMVCWTPSHSLAIDYANDHMTVLLFARACIKDGGGHRTYKTLLLGIRMRRVPRAVVSNRMHDGL